MKLFKRRNCYTHQFCLGAIWFWK